MARRVVSQYVAGDLPFLGPLFTVVETACTTAVTGRSPTATPGDSMTLPGSITFPCNINLPVSPGATRPCWALHLVLLTGTVAPVRLRRDTHKYTIS